MMRSANREQQIERLSEAVDRFRCAIETVGVAAMSSPLGGWSPRDIVAHLIGWNDGILEGCRQLLRGELPFYDVDPGEDYSKVNERFVDLYASCDPEALLADLTDSAERLGSFLAALDPGVWGRDSGVVHGEERLTVRNTVDDLIGDYLHHYEQIRDWAPPD